MQPPPCASPPPGPPTPRSALRGWLASQLPLGTPVRCFVRHRLRTCHPCLLLHATSQRTFRVHKYPPSHHSCALPRRGARSPSPPLALRQAATTPELSSGPQVGGGSRPGGPYADDAMERWDSLNSCRFTMRAALAEKAPPGGTLAPAAGP